jgi:hypothetical protein
MNVIQAEMNGMLAKNTERVAIGDPLAYKEQHFCEKAEELRILASKHNDQL